VTGPVCGWVLDDGNRCAVQVEAAGKLCGDHRRVEAAAKAVAARAAHARRRPAPPGLPPLADEDAAAIFEVLDRHGVAYVVIGGMAAAMWGSDLPRTTDADITPAADTANLDCLAAALAETGARLRVEGVPEGIPAPLDADTLAGRNVITMLTDHGPSMSAAVRRAPPDTPTSPPAWLSATIPVCPSPTSPTSSLPKKPPAGPKTSANSPPCDASWPGYAHPTLDRTAVPSSAASRPMSRQAVTDSWKTVRQ
jgi:hypothetical protein